MNLSSHLFQRLLRLPPPPNQDLIVQHDLHVPMPDGVDLLADHWAPRVGGSPLPTALIRTPYGRRSALGRIIARTLAERGFQVLIQSTRGTFGSGGVFDDFDSWPPRGHTPQRFHLRRDGALSTQPPGESTPDNYHYDPVDPTPAVGGARLSGTAGRVDNTALEARTDVLTCTTAPLDDDVNVIGEVGAEIFFRSSLPFADVFVRLCDVDTRGRSYNISDGLISLTGADEISCAIVRLWPTAYRFKRGHRIRVQISSGVFPRYARNPGTGEPHATATTLRAADQHVYHDPAHPSAVILPIRQAQP